MRSNLPNVVSSAGLLLLAGATTAQQTRHTDSVTVPANITGSLMPLHRDLSGFSIEPVWVNDFLENRLAADLFLAAGEVAGTPPPIRIGGNTADNSYLKVDGSLEDDAKAQAIPAPSGAKMLNITPSWFEAWGGYFAEGTNLTYTLNLHINDSNWQNAVDVAEAAWRVLVTEGNKKLVRFEIGNEVDHFIAKGWRNSTWGVVPYAEQFRAVTDRIRDADWYKAAGPDKAPAFAAGSFADPPWLPDQQDEIDDMDILNLTTRAGLVSEGKQGLNIDSFVVHMYPGSTCDPLRWHRMRLNLITNHTAVWQNVSQYIPQSAAARDVGNATFVMGETNSISCGGRSGISDTLGAALWAVDYTLSLASIGAEHVYFHLGGQNEYSALQPIGYNYKGENITSGIRSTWYAHYFVAHVVSRNESDGSPEGAWGIQALEGANASDFSGFGVYDGAAALRKLVFLDMGVWNGTQGLGNPSTLSATDNTDTGFHTLGARPVSNMTVTTPWCEGSKVGVVRMTGPGTNAKSGFAVGGVSFDPETGAREGEPVSEVVTVGADGVVNFSLTMAEGVLLELDLATATTTCSTGPRPAGGESAASAVAFSGLAAWVAMAAACLMLAI